MNIDLNRAAYLDLPHPMGKHTPGPWLLQEDANVGQCHVVVEDKVFRSHIARTWDSTLCNEHKGDYRANARLIAAAPDLLATLEAILPTLLRGSTQRAMVVIAIVKATTETGHEAFNAAQFDAEAEQDE